MGARRRLTLPTRTSSLKASEGGFIAVVVCCIALAKTTSARR